MPGEATAIPSRRTHINQMKPLFSGHFIPAFCGQNQVALTYGIVKQNGGFISVYSDPGKGTTFDICLPQHSDGFVGEQQKAHAGPAECGHETILLVEDEESILNMTAEILERFGYTVLSASTPGEAIRLAESYSDEINMIITDVVMPEMSGRALAERLLGTYRNLKCLFMSGYTANVIADHGVLEEGVQFIHKPFGMRDLAAKVREALDDPAVPVSFDVH